MGDPFGNGPELTVKALYEECRPVVVGDLASMERALAICNSPLSIRTITDVGEARFEYGTIDLLDLGLIHESDIPVRSKPYHVGPTTLGGEAAFRYVTTVIELALSGNIDATVTNALSKEAINMADHHYSGHTEIYAEYTNTEKYSMMLAWENLRVVHVSTHCSLREACDRVKKERILDVIHIAHEACLALGIQNPKIGVAGLNPHSGENGLFGREEIEEIQPAIDQALAEGITIPDKSPTPPDTIFSKALGGWYDVVVAMYHDQGHIPLKVKGFVYSQELGSWEAVKGVNITLGLPIIRTSVDHGTGYDRAGDGSALELSLLNAIEYAIQMALAKEQQQ
ncbi:MAG: 4-hydroxythreonine-4-phosphate dehydrogenase PdxA [Sphaerochaeta sp.]